MPVRDVVHIDEDLCDGCGICVPSCAEGAIQIIDGKAKLVSDIFCDGLGSCLGECPLDAITVIKRDADDFDEEKAMEHVEKMKKQTVQIEDQQPQKMHHHGGGHGGGGCPGSRQQTFNAPKESSSAGLFNNASPNAPIQSSLTTWPVQFHLLNPNAEFLMNSDFLLCADCVPFAYPEFHSKMLAGKILAVGCPKLDDTAPYLQKLTHIIENANLKSLTVAVMEVPCCSGLLQLAAQAVNTVGKEISIKIITVGVQGDILKEEDIIAGK